VYSLPSCESLSVPSVSHGAYKSFRSGYTVLSTSSPRNFEYVKSLGATEVFDYNEPKVGQKIREYTQNKLKLAWDTISEGESANIIAEALSTEPGSRYGSILPNKFPREDVHYASTLMYTIFGEPFHFGPRAFPAIPEDFEYTKKFIGITEQLLADGKLKPHTAKIGKNGLEGVLKGLDDLKDGKVSGEKLVYRVSETP
jgi:NADPH:quinone reductase-like Zn-dependent oxidoreductase